MYAYSCYLCGTAFTTHLLIACQCLYGGCSHELCDRCSIPTYGDPVGFNPYTDDTLSESVKNYKYFLTFTKKPDAKFADVQMMFHRFTKTTAKGFQKIWYVEEHLDSNPHLHAYIECKRSLAPAYLNRYAKYGKIDKQYAKGTHSEIKDYMEKENKISVIL